MSISVEQLSSLNKQYAFNAIGQLARNQNPALMQVLGSSKTGLLEVADTLPTSLHHLVLDGENTQAAFAQLAASLLTPGAQSRQDFIKKHHKTPQVLALVTLGQQLSSLPTAQPQYDPVLLVLLQSASHQLISFHPCAGSMAVFNPNCRISEIKLKKG